MVAGLGDPPGAPDHAPASLPRLALIAPDRQGLPGLDRYATLQLPDGQRRLVGYTEATRGCRHLCRHCPIVPVYGGQFRVVPVDVVLADIRAQVAAGAQHITFGDPDFFNGPTHARRIVEALAREWPHITYDVVIKVEHLLRHRPILPVLHDTGCLFITSAVESFDDGVLARLEKHHTCADIVRTVDLLADIGLTFVPTFVAFTPWTTRGQYVQMLDWINRLGLVDHVAPIQLSIRLLIPAGSRLLELEEVRPIIQPFDPTMLAYPWRHRDPEMDALHGEVARIVGRRPSAPRRDVFGAVSAAADARVGAHTALITDELLAVNDTPRVARAAVPYLNEPWYC
jgi:radical SAM superfamily enzyme YgiQ (UPF0313 family)